MLAARHAVYQGWEEQSYPQPRAACTVARERGEACGYDGGWLVRLRSFFGCGGFMPGGSLAGLSLMASSPYRVAWRAA